MEQIAKAKGLKWTQVPFKGGADNMNALLGGHIDVTTNSTGWAELVNAGKFRLLVTWGAQRTKNWPNVPTLKEVGIDMVSNSPFGIGGPKGMDPAVVKVLHDAFKKGMEEQSYKDTILKLDMEPYYLEHRRLSRLRDAADRRAETARGGAGAKAAVGGARQSSARPDP